MQRTSGRTAALAKHNLSLEDEQRIGDLFNRLDVNKDGKLDIRDLSKALHELRVPQVPGQAQVNLDEELNFMCIKS